MIEDDVIRGVRAAREEYARLHGLNIRAMVADLQDRDAAGDWPVVCRPARRLATAAAPDRALAKLTQRVSFEVALFAWDRTFACVVAWDSSPEHRRLQRRKRRARPIFRDFIILQK